MLVSISAKKEDPNAYTWYKYNGKRPVKVAPTSNRDLSPNDAFGIRPIAGKPDFYLVFPDKQSQKIRINKTRKSQLEKNSNEVKYKDIGKTAPTSRAGIGGRKQQVYTFDHPRWKPAKAPTAAEEKRDGIDCKHYQWRIYKKAKILNLKLNQKDPITLQKNDIIGVRFIKPATGGKIVTPEGMRRSIPKAEVYDQIIQATEILPKNRWPSKKIDAETVAHANRSATQKDADEQKQLRQAAREARLAQERERRKKREKERQEKERQEREFEAMLQRRAEQAEADRAAEMQARKDATIDPSEYVREQLQKNKLDDEVLDALDMDDLDNIDINLDEMKTALKDFDEEYSPDEEPTDDLLASLDDLLNSVKQDTEDEITNELDDSDSDDTDSEDDLSDADEDGDSDDGSEDDSETDEDTDDEEEPDFSEEDDEESDTGDTDSMDDSEDTEEVEDEVEENEEDEEEPDFSDEDEDVDPDAEESDEEGTEEDEDESSDIDEMMSALDDADIGEDEEQEENEDETDDEEEFDDEEVESDETPSDSDELDDEFQDEEDEDEEGLDLSDEDDEDLEDSEQDDTNSDDDEDFDDYESDEAPDDADVDAAEDELGDLEKELEDIDLEKEEDQEAKLPEEADVITFNDDEDNRQFLIFDVNELPSNDKILVLKLYDMTNEPEEYHTVRVNRDHKDDFMKSIEVVDRMNAKTFGTTVDFIEDYSRSKEKLI